MKTIATDRGIRWPGTRAEHLLVPLKKMLDERVLKAARVGCESAIPQGCMKMACASSSQGRDGKGGAKALGRGGG